MCVGSRAGAKGRSCIAAAAAQGGRSCSARSTGQHCCPLEPPRVEQSRVPCQGPVSPACGVPRACSHQGPGYRESVRGEETQEPVCQEQRRSLREKRKLNLDLCTRSNTQTAAPSSPSHRSERLGRGSVHGPRRTRVRGVRHPGTRSSAEPRRIGRPHRAQSLGPEAQTLSKPRSLHALLCLSTHAKVMKPPQFGAAQGNPGDLREAAEQGEAFPTQGRAVASPGAQEPRVSQAACESSSLQGWMSRSASRDAAGVGKGCPAAGYGSHHSLLRKEKMGLFLPPHQLPPRLPRQTSSVGCPQATAPAEQPRERHWQALVTTPAPVLEVWGFFCGQYHLNLSKRRYKPEPVQLFGGFRRRGCQYKPGLVL